MKQKTITGLVILIIIGLITVIIWGSKGKQKAILSQNEHTNNRTSQATTSSDIPTFFYGNTCPHCSEVEKWIEENKVGEKISIVKKEVYDNQQNAKELTKAAESCGLPTDSVGVPFLYAESKCFIGTPDVINYLSAKAGLTSATGSAERNQE